MAHDEKILRRSLAQFEEDKQRRAEAFARRRETIFRQIPRLEEIDRELLELADISAELDLRMERIMNKVEWRKADAGRGAELF